MIDIIDYLQRRLNRAYALLSLRTVDFNNKPLPERKAVVTVEQHINQFLKSVSNSVKWLVMPGLRGVGKSTLMAQIYLKLANSQAKINLLHFSLEEVVNNLNSNLYEVLKAYEKILGEDLEALKIPTFIFIDEVQIDPKWARTLKTFYDNTSHIFFFCTGSSAVHLQMDADIAGRRAYIEKLYPLSFVEFQNIYHNQPIDADLGQKIFQAIYYAQNPKDSYNRLKKLDSTMQTAWIKYSLNHLTTYLESGTLPLNYSQNNVVRMNHNIKAMLDKVINTDLRKIKQFEASSLTAINNLMSILADSNDIISVEKLSRILACSRNQIFSFLDALNQTELLIKISSQGNTVVNNRNPAKYLFMSPVIRNFYHGIASERTKSMRQGLLLEDIAGLHFYKHFISIYEGNLTYGKDRQTDFILQVNNGHKLAVEFGLGQKGSSQMEYTLQNTDCNWAITFSNTPLQIDNNCLFIPLKYFLLI